MGRACINFISESLFLLLVFCSHIAFIYSVYPHNTQEKFVIMCTIHLVGYDKFIIM